jgi:hypothetical protein
MNNLGRINRAEGSNPSFRTNLSDEERLSRANIVGRPKVPLRTSSDPPLRDGSHVFTSDKISTKAVVVLL